MEKKKEPKPLLSSLQRPFLGGKNESIKLSKEEKEIVENIKRKKKEAAQKKLKKYWEDAEQRYEKVRDILEDLWP